MKKQVDDYRKTRSTLGKKLFDLARETQSVELVPIKVGEETPMGRGDSSFGVRPADGLDATVNCYDSNGCEAYGAHHHTPNEYGFVLEGEMTLIWWDEDRGVRVEKRYGVGDAFSVPSDWSHDAVFHGRVKLVTAFVPGFKDDKFMAEHV